MREMKKCAVHRDTPELEYDWTGDLPSVAPLANLFVPFQRSAEPQYDARKGMVRGTLFPGLDLPFMGKVNNKEKSRTPMHELQALSFALVELSLYLDTHADDAEALDLFLAYRELYQKCLNAYTQTCGPINKMHVGNSGKYDWLNAPWPWEYCQNKED